MSITDPTTTGRPPAPTNGHEPTPPASDGTELWQRRITRAQARYDAAALEYNSSLADLLALVVGKPRVSDVPTQIRANQVEVGDQLQWEDGWWYVNGVDGVTLAEVELTITRVGYEPWALPLEGDALVVVVRAGS